MSKAVIAVDAMGGDNAPECIVDGALLAVNDSEDFELVLCGDEERLKRMFSERNYDVNNSSRIRFRNTTEVIEMAESPVAAIKKKKDSSMVVGLNMVKNGEADAFMSAGNSGALLAGGALIVGRIKGIERPPFAPLVPTANGVSLILDCGANVDARANHLVQFAQIGAVYMEAVVGVKDPRVAIVNIGAEEEKGNALVKETYPLLKELNSINFTGCIEARDIPAGDADVIVCEAFVGNVILKLYEGLATTLIGKIKEGLTSSVMSTIGAALAKPALKKTLKDFDTAKYGGAPLLGCKGLVVKTHGSAKPVEIRNTILQCAQFKEMDVNGKIIQKMGL